MTTGERVYEYLKRFPDHSHAKIAEALGLSTRTVHRQIHKLEAAGLIKIVASGKYSVYYFLRAG